MKAAITATALGSLVLLSGCGSDAGSPPGRATTVTCAPIYAALGLRPSAQHDLDAAGGCLPQDLTFSGEVTSHVRMAVISRPCPVPRANTYRAGFDLQFLVGSTRYSLDFNTGDTFYQGVAQTYRLPIPAPTDLLRPVEQPVVTLTAPRADGNILLPSQTWKSTTSGTIGFDQESLSGHLDFHLLRDAAGARPVHVSGAFRCAQPSPTPGASS
jgi:hypothetical protein